VRYLLGLHGGMKYLWDFMAGWEESITVVIYDYPGENGKTVLVKQTENVPRTEIALPL